MEKQVTTLLGLISKMHGRDRRAIKKEAIRLGLCKDFDAELQGLLDKGSVEVKYDHVKGALVKVASNATEVNFSDVVSIEEDEPIADFESVDPNQINIFEDQVLDEDRDTTPESEVIIGITDVIAESVNPEHPEPPTEEPPVEEVVVITVEDVIAETNGETTKEKKESLKATLDEMNVSYRSNSSLKTLAKLYIENVEV